MPADISFFDVISYLEDRGVEFSRQGKNVTSGWIETNCPFCPIIDPDPTMHLGINLSTRLINCWRCGSKGSILRLIVKIDRCSYQDVEDKILPAFKDYSMRDLKRDIIIRTSTNGNILPECLKEFPEPYLEYLKGRNFDPDQLVKKYGLRAYANIGFYKFRIIVPIIMGGKVVNFTAMDTTGEQSPKYIHCRNDDAIIPMKECLYNIDTVRDTALIVEGVTDVWRMGDGAVATLGIQYTHEQVSLLATKGVVKAVVMYDSDAIKQAKRLAGALSAVISNVEVIELDKGDPGDFSEEYAKEVRKEAGL